MIKKFLELIKFKKVEEPELNYAEYEDPYIQKIYKELNNEEENNNELLEEIR
tara:strand:- start:123 stop:278 length:156 start_codon:yes stop_codon:yes gene_type:complete